MCWLCLPVLFLFELLFFIFFKFSLYVSITTCDTPALSLIYLIKYGPSV